MARIKWVLVPLILLSACGDGRGTPTAESEVGAVTSSISSDGLPTHTRTMDFELCLKSITAQAEQFGAPINLVETSDVRMVRFNTSDGSVLLTCSRPDRKQVIVISPHQG